MLSITRLTAGYGSIPVLTGVDLAVAKGEVLALLGRNGVGKTTLLRVIAGLLAAASGRITLEGVALNGLPAHAIARALAARPTVMLLDEPTEGIQPNVVHDLAVLIATLTRESGLAVLLVEQNIDFALHTASRCVVMEKGRIVHEGSPDQLSSDALLKRYLAI